MKKRIVSLTLALLMTISVISTSAMAAAPDDDCGIMPLGLACMNPDCEGGTIRDIYKSTTEGVTNSKPQDCGCVIKTTQYTDHYERVCDRCGMHMPDKSVPRTGRSWVDNSKCTANH